jgi:hypothetical protein
MQINGFTSSSRSVPLGLPRTPHPRLHILLTAIFTAMRLSPVTVRREVGEPACRPGSVRPLARGGGHPSGTAVADSLVRSTREHRAGRPRTLAQGTVVPLLDLAPGGVYQATAVTCGAGGLLHHRFTLTPARAGAVCFLWHCPAGHPGSALPTTLPCGARTFLAGLAPSATARPTHPCSGYGRAGRRAADPGQQLGLGRMGPAKAPRVPAPTEPYSASPPKVLPLRMLPNSQTHAPPTRAWVQYG